MALLNKSISLSLTPDLNNPPTIFCSQYDEGETQITATIYTDSTLRNRVTVTGLTAKVQGTKESRKGFSYDATITNNTVVFTLQMQMTAEPGMTYTEIVLFNGDNRVGTANFILMVEPAGLADDVDISETVLPEYIAAARESAAEAAASAEAAAGSAATAAQDAATATDGANRAEQSALTAESAADVATDAAATVTDAVTILKDNEQAIKDAADNAQAAQQSADAAAQSAAEAAADAATVAASVSTVTGAVEILQNNETAIENAAANAQAAQQSADAAKAWAVGPSAAESAGTDDNNAKYWANVAEQYAGQFTGGVVFRGSILFADLPTTLMMNGDMYDIKDAFTTDSRFFEGAGIPCAAGTEVIWVEQENKWNILTPAGVHTFNGRNGDVIPQAGDYTAAMVGVNPATAPTASAPGTGGTIPAPPINSSPGSRVLTDAMIWDKYTTDIILPVDPVPEPTQSGAIWIETV